MNTDQSSNDRDLITAATSWQLAAQAASRSIRIARLTGQRAVTLGNQSESDEGDLMGRPGYRITILWPATYI